MCNERTLYTLYKYNEEDESGETVHKTSLETYDMETGQRSYVFRNVPGCGLIDVGDVEKCFVHIPFKLFAFHYYKIVERDEFVSDYYVV